MMNVIFFSLEKEIGEIIGTTHHVELYSLSCVKMNETNSST